MWHFWPLTNQFQPHNTLSKSGKLAARTTHTSSATLSQCRSLCKIRRCLTFYIFFKPSSWKPVFSLWCQPTRIVLAAPPWGWVESLRWKSMLLCWREATRCRGQQSTWWPRRIGTEWRCTGFCRQSKFWSICTISRSLLCVEFPSIPWIATCIHNQGGSSGLRDEYLNSCSDSINRQIWPEA